jgi:ABC-2 type transport system permease protein
VLAYALVVADVDWTLGRALAIPVAVFAGALIYGAVWVALATIAFWIVDAIEFVNAFTYGGSFLSQYPIGIFGRWLRGLVVFLVPVAFVAYFPALYLLGKEDELGLPRALQYASPFVAIAAALVAGLVWRNAVRHYRSAGG